MKEDVVFVNLHSSEYDSLFDSANIYVKNTQVEAIQVTEENLISGYYEDRDVSFDETSNQYNITTYIMSGEGPARKAEVECVRQIKPGEWIVTNPKIEENDHPNNYAIPDETFKSHYQETDRPGVYQSIGKAQIIKNQTGKNVVITAPWGGKQYGNAECYFCREQDNRYILSENDFKTYKLVKD